MRLRCCMLAGILAASIGGTSHLGAQAVDSLGRPRPVPVTAHVGEGPSRDPSQFRWRCGSTLSTNNPAYRILGADQQLLFMSPADTSSAVRSATPDGLEELDPSDIVNLEVVRRAEATYGKAYTDGVIVITLNPKGTAAWLKAAAARAAKPAPAPQL